MNASGSVQQHLARISAATRLFLNENSNQASAPTGFGGYEASSQLPGGGVIWIGEFFNHNCRADASKYFCEYLISSGCKVGLMPSCPPTKMPSNVLHSFLAQSKHYQLGPHGQNVVSVQHLTSPLDASALAPHWVSYIDWPYGNLPDEWLAVLKEADEVWAPSQITASRCISSGVAEERVAVVPFGVNTSVFQPNASPMVLATKKSFKFLAAGGTSWRKGVDVLLEAYGKAFTSADDVCLVVKDDDTSSIDTCRYKIWDFQSIPGNPEILYLSSNASEQELASLYVACHCLVHPCRAESNSTEVARAIACGIPSIFTDNSAGKDLVSESDPLLIDSIEMTGISDCIIADVLPPGTYSYLQPSLDCLIEHMRCVYNNYDAANQAAKRSRSAQIESLSWCSRGALVRDLLSKYGIG